MNISISRRDEIAERALVRHAIDPQLDVTHSLARAFEQAGGVVEEGAEEEADIAVFRVRVDISESGIVGAGGRAPVMDQLAHVRTTRTQSLEPGFHQAAKRVGMGKPLFDRRIAPTSDRETKKGVHSLRMPVEPAFAKRAA